MIDFTKFNNVSIIVGLILVATIWYAGTSTGLVPNLDEETKEFRYTDESLVPKGSISNEIIFVQIILVAILLFSNQMKGTEGVRITEREFKERIAKEIIKKQNIALPDGKLELKRGDFRIDPHVVTRYITEGGKRTLFKYICQVTITNSKGNDFYYIVSGHPMTGMIDDFVPVDEQLSITDKCQDCGRFFDEKYILPEELKQLKDLKYLTQ
jgi:hypothetical protein|tara:strand:+ start:2271 stop:2903 length:633 start_codon:yes stop_codon:yes gene_type:complete